MRRLSRFGMAVIVAALAAPRLIVAQFTEPTREELQMKTDPKAPDAAAVYLYREDVTDQEQGTRTIYERVKVLTEKGKELATMRLPYEPGADKIDVQARTIHADGTILPMTEKPADLVEMKTKGFQLDTLVFTLPSVEVGCILDYRITVKPAHGIDDPTWWIQQNYFVHKAHYSFKRGNSNTRSFASRLGPGAKVETDEKTRTYSLDLTDIDPLPNDDWMPPLNTFRWRVWFFRTTFATSEAYWVWAGQMWGQGVLDYIIKPTGSLKKAVSEIVSPGDTERQKVQKIYAAVMKLENTDFTRHKSHEERKKEKIKDIHNAQDVWRDQQGTSDQIALLFVALSRAANLHVDAMKVADRREAVFDQSVMSTAQLQDYIAVAQLDGKDVYLDPGEKMCPFGMLHWRHALASGFLMRGDSAIIARTPALHSNASNIQRVADLTVEESGAVHGVVRMVMSGQEALYWRHVALDNDPDEVKKRMNEWIHADLPEGVQGEFDHFLGIDQYDTNLMAIVNVSGNLGTITGKRFFLPGQFFKSKTKHPFVAQEKRTVAVDVHYARSERDDVTYRLPAGYQMESGPKTEKIDWAEHAGFSNVTRVEGNSVDVVRDLAYEYTLLNPQEYGKLREFYQKVAEADQQQLVLTRTASASTPTATSKTN